MSVEHRQFDIRVEQALDMDARGVASLLSTPEAEVSFIRLPAGGGELQPFSGDAEEHALVVGGVLTYITSPCREGQVIRGGWVSAQSGEPRGYSNRGDRPVSMFMFRVTNAHPGFGGGVMRIRRADENKASHQVIFQTPMSRGELLCLMPGTPESLPSVLCRGALVTEGRVMALFRGERIALEAGEGMAFSRQGVEFVGVGGQSRVAVFSTIA